MNSFTRRDVRDWRHDDDAKNAGWVLGFKAGKKAHRHRTFLAMLGLFVVFIGLTAHLAAAVIGAVFVCLLWKLFTSERWDLRRASPPEPGEQTDEFR